MSELIVPPYAIYDETQISGFFGEKYRFLSNFWPAPVEYLNCRYGSTEAAYQAAKCKTDSERTMFQDITAEKAKALSKRVQIRENWDEVRLEVMRYLVFQKFSRHAALRQLLLSTGDKKLNEFNSWRDNFWGISFHEQIEERMGAITPFGKKHWVMEDGRNHLGKILMDVRDAFK